MAQPEMISNWAGSSDSSGQVNFYPATTFFHPVWQLWLQPSVTGIPARALVFLLTARFYG